MLNQSVLVGRLVADPFVKETEKGNVSNITIAVPRPYKNEEGVYEADFIDCVLWRGVADSTAEYCKKGDLIGVRGRLQTDVKEHEGEKKKILSIIAEKITFLSSKPRNQEHEMDNDDIEEEMDK